MKKTVEALLEPIVAIAALATIPLTILQAQGVTSTALESAEWAVWAVFAIELLFFVSFDWPAHLVSLPALGRLIVVVVSFPPFPNFLALTSLARLARLIRLLRLTGVTALGVTALKAILGRRGLIHIAAITALLILAGGGCLSILEPETVKGGFGDGVWWAIVTASTVGYGDIAPSTALGRIIAVLLMIVGIGLMSTLAASITTYFVHHTEENNMDEVLARLGRIERLLAERKALDDERPPG